MAQVIIDTSTDPDVLAYEEFVELEQRTYLVKFDWNERDDFWSLSLYDHNEEAIATGRPARIGVNLLRGVVDSRKPPGLLMAIDMTEQHQEAGVSDLGGVVKLVYIPLADALELAQS